jgi:hypothetical protein
MTIDGLADETIEKWIRDDKAGTAERILFSLHEHISILESTLIELSDLMELIADLHGNKHNVLYDLYWRKILSNDLIHIKFKTAISIQNITLWILILNPFSELMLPEIRRFFTASGGQLIRWGEGQCSPSSHLPNTEEMAKYVIELRESVRSLANAKEYIVVLVLKKFQTQI